MKVIFINIACKFLTTSKFFPTIKNWQSLTKILAVSTLKNLSLLQTKYEVFS